MVASVGEGFAPPSSLVSARAATGQATEDARSSAAAASVAASQNPAAASQALTIHVQAKDQLVQEAISQATGKGMRINAVI